MNEQDKKQIKNELNEISGRIYRLREMIKDEIEEGEKYAKVIKRLKNATMELDRAYFIVFPIDF